MVNPWLGYLVIFIMGALFVGMFYCMHLYAKEIGPDLRRYLRNKLK